jgi:hypothetical protein
MQKDLEFIYSTLVVFGVISMALYLLLLIRPIRLLPRTQANSDAAGAAVNSGAARGRDVPQANSQQQSSYANRVPPHVAPSSVTIANSTGSNLLVDGLLAFRHGRAACFEQSLESSLQASNRKDRARVLSRVMEESSASSPPPKGSTIVVSIPCSEVGCPKLRRVLYLLGTYYNLLVILVVGTTFKHEDLVGKIQTLRSVDSSAPLSMDVLPDHRIVAASTVAGRVAFVRQLQRIELVLDFDPEIKSNLTRFGHRVFVYGRCVAVDEGASRLGSDLLS